MRQRGIIGIIVLIILALVIAGGAYYLGRASKKPQTTGDQKVTQKDTWPTPSPDPTTNWKTYTSIHGYLIKYPPNLFPTPDDERFTVTTFVTDKSVITEDGFLELEGLEKSGYTIEVGADKGAYHSFEDLVSEMERGELAAGRTPRFEKTTFDGYPALVQPSLGSQGKDIRIMKGNTLYLIRILCYLESGAVGFDKCEEKYPDLLIIFDRMISTFKITA